MRAIRVGTRADALVIASRVDASYGFPCCERLSGAAVSIVVAGVAVPVGAAAACPCKDAHAPDARCPFRSLAETSPVELADLSWAYPVRETKPATLDALTAEEKSAITTVTDAELKPVAASGAQPATEEAKP